MTSTTATTCGFPGTFRAAEWVATPKGKTGNRLALFDEAPPQRRTPAAVHVPHLQSIVICSRADYLAESAFLQPVDLLPPALAELDAHPPQQTEPDHLPASSSSDAEAALYANRRIERKDVPSFFRLQRYMWPDSSLREMVETVLATSAAARLSLLAPPPSKEEEEQRQEEEEGRQQKHNRSGGGPKVEVYHVFPNPQAKPSLVRLAQLDLTTMEEGEEEEEGDRTNTKTNHHHHNRKRPRVNVATKEDLLTLRELRQTRYLFELGDLLVLVRKN